MLLKKLLPNLHVPSVFEIDLEALQKKGIKGIISDLDNTLVAWDRPQATPELLKWFEQVQEKGFKLIIVSNNNKNRVETFVQSLGFPFIHRAKKPAQRSFRMATEMMALEPEEVVVIGDQLFTDVLGGNRANLYTILVSPVVQTDGFFTRFNRKLERLALGMMRKRGMITWEEQGGYRR